MEKGLLASSAGATGFVGSHTLAALQAMEDIRPVALVRDAGRLPADYQGEVRVGDIRDAAFVAQALPGVDAICVATAWTSAWGHAEASRRYLLAPTLALLDAAVQADIPRIVFPSSVTARVLRTLPAGHLRGSPDSLWPHMANVNRIEDYLQTLTARGSTTAVLRLGHFVGEHYGLGMLPILLPRLRSHLVPWVGKGRTTIPLIAGRDVGQAMALAATRPGLTGYTTLDVVGGNNPPRARSSASCTQPTVIPCRTSAYPLPWPTASRGRWQRCRTSPPGIPSSPAVSSCCWRKARPATSAPRGCWATNTAGALERRHTRPARRDAAGSHPGPAHGAEITGTATEGNGMSTPATHLD